MKTSFHDEKHCFLVILVLLVSLTCKPPHDGRQDTGILRVAAIMMFLEAKSVTLTDNNNGTVSVVTSYMKGGSTSFLAKKCLQGQVYRSAQNDCHGTGTAADNYGAALLQYCNANDDSCNVGPGSGGYILAGSGLSEAFNSCKSDTTIGRTNWEVIMDLDALSENSRDTALYASFSGLFPDMAVGMEVWTATSTSLSSKAVFFYRLNSGAGTTSYDFKTNRRYVLCTESGNRI